MTQKRIGPNIKTEVIKEYLTPLNINFLKKHEKFTLYLKVKYDGWHDKKFAVPKDSLLRYLMLDIVSDSQDLSERGCYFPIQEWT